MNGFDALKTFSRWDGTAEGLVPCLEAIEGVMSSMFESFKAETAAQMKKRGVSVMALVAARSNVQHALEEARAGEAPDPIAVTRLVAEACAAMYWCLAIDARHGIEIREKGHRPSESERDEWLAARIDTLEAAGEKQPYAKLHPQLEAEGIFISLDGLRKAVRRARRRRATKTQT